MRKVTACKSCHNPFKIKGGFRFCANLGCTEYNKRYGGKQNVSQRQKGMKKKKKKM